KPANNSLYVPVSIERFVAWHRPSPGNLLHCRIVLHESVPSERLADVQLFDGQALCAELINVRIKLVSRQTLIKPKARELERAVCSIDWHDVPLEIPHEPSDPTLRRSGTWLLFSSNPELTLGASLPACFEDAGESCLVVSPGAEYKFQDGKVCVRQGQKADLVRLFDSLHAMGHPPLRGVVYAHDFVPVTTQDGLASRCFEPVVNNTVELLALAQALSTLEAVEPPKLWLVTRGAVAVN